MKKKTSIIIGVGLIIVFAIILLGSTTNKNTNTDKISENENINNVEVRDGIQYITINARGGYSPRLSEAQSGIPTKLIMKTDGTYDCSSSLLIRSIGIQKILPNTGNTEIDLGIPKSGNPISGMCGMGMYNFNIDFK
ncbi:MAG: hypothetical protein NTX85_02630 [Candidatus Nomurabacteria bacterium]|nr:hypothetical protein [Candidatus Nomurabacteria bacterium]